MSAIIQGYPKYSLCCELLLLHVGYIFFEYTISCGLISPDITTPLVIGTILYSEDDALLR